MIVYQPWYDNGVPYDQHYQYPSDKVYTTLERAEFEVFEEGYFFDGQIGGEDLGDENSKVYKDMYESKSYAVIVKIKLIGEIK